MAGGKLNAGVFETGGARMAQWMNNIAIVRATTTNAGDSIKITGANGTALSPSNPGWITLPSTSTAGQLKTYQMTADVTTLLSAAHWGIGTTGNITGAIIRVLAINYNNEILNWGFCLLGGRNTLLETDVIYDNVNVISPEYVLSKAVTFSSSNTCREVGYVRADFNDTGDIWSIQSGVNDVVTGETADGLWQTWNITYTGFASAPTAKLGLWYQVGRIISAQFNHELGGGSLTGTSNSTAFQVTLPAKAYHTHTGFTYFATNNGSSLSTPGLITTSAASATADLYKDTVSTTGWTNANAKGAKFIIDYPVGPSSSFID